MADEFIVTILDGGRTYRIDVPGGISPGRHAQIEQLLAGITAALGGDVTVSSLASGVAVSVAEGAHAHAPGEHSHAHPVGGHSHE